MVDLVTNLVKITHVKTTQSAKKSQVFVDTWLFRYLLPEHVLTDNGPEFVRHK